MRKRRPLADEEVDLSDEWDSLSQEVLDAATQKVAEGTPGQAAPVEAAADEEENFFEIEEPAASETQNAVTAKLYSRLKCTQQRRKRRKMQEAAPAASEAAERHSSRRRGAGEACRRSASAEVAPKPEPAAEPVRRAKRAPPEAAPAAQSRKPKPTTNLISSWYPRAEIPKNRCAAAPPRAPKTPMTSDQFLSDLAAELGTETEPQHVSRADILEIPAAIPAIRTR